ncbi:hypothetical protein D3C85_1932430 [compost metagenome]
MIARTMRSLNTDSSISVFFKSIIGPKTRKASSGPAANMLLKEAAMNASDVEHSDST